MPLEFGKSDLYHKKLTDTAEKRMKKLYENAYKEALKKAQTILGKTDLNLRKPVTITDNSYGIIRPYYSYYNRNYAVYTPELLKEKDEVFIDRAMENPVLINPQKVSFSKTVYIEFEMD